MPYASGASTTIAEGGTSPAGTNASEYPHGAASDAATGSVGDEPRENMTLSHSGERPDSTQTARMDLPDALTIARKAVPVSMKTPIYQAT